MNQDQLKKLVADAALKHVVEDRVVGVGSGSTVNLFIDALASSSTFRRRFSCDCFAQAQGLGG